MLQVFKYIIFLISLLFSMGTVFAIEMPFTDIRSTDPYYGSVIELYEGRVISDNGDHLFRPNDLMNRDFFVSLAVGIGCHKCETPSIGDILKYQISPFIDLPKTNQYYYCIAYAKDNNIAQGYITDNNGKATCEDKRQYMSSPFCAANTITRIEAVAILLRRAKLWDDTLNNGNFDRNNIIPDTTTYWYGYAKKGIEAGILEQKSDKKIGQDEKITRGEFAIMAARILRYTQCQMITSNNRVPLDIIIISANGIQSQKTSFPQRSTELLSTISGTGSWDKRWTLVNTLTNETLTGNTDTYPIDKLSCGTWINTVSLIDKNTQAIVSTSYNTITIECGNQKTNWISVDIQAKPISGEIMKPINFSSIVGGGSGIISYRWNYDDGSTSQTPKDTTHIFTNSGIYTVTLTVIDASGNTAQSSLVVQITGDRDTDGDGILDPNDACPLVYAKNPSGCPIIITYPNINPTNNQGTIEAAIGVRNGSGAIIKKTDFLKGEVFSLIPITRDGNWNYSWHATNPITKETLSGKGPILPGSIFGIGDWRVTLDIIDPMSGKIVASPSVTIRIRDMDNPIVNQIPCVSITANPMVTGVNSPIISIPTVCTSNNPLEYNWSYGDNTTSTDTGTTTHIYSIPGTYTIILTVTDTVTGAIGESKVIVTITGITTSDNSITNNICLEAHRKIQGILMGSPNCVQCPCSNSITIDSPLRSCDVVFPTILSPTLDAIYSRGGFYLIP